MCRAGIIEKQLTPFINRSKPAAGEETASSCLVKFVEINLLLDVALAL